MIDAFLKLMEDDTEEVDIKTLFKDKKEQISWEKMVNIFETIEIDNVSDGLRTITEKYKLTRQEELNILAYVKFLEMMVTKVNVAKDIIAKGSAKILYNNNIISSNLIIYSQTTGDITLPIEFSLKDDRNNYYFGSSGAFESNFEFGKIDDENILATKN